MRPCPAVGDRGCGAVTTVRIPAGLDDPQAARDGLAGACEGMARLAGHTGELLAGLPEPGLRSPEQRALAEQAKDRARAMRGQFMAVHADAVYDWLTEAAPATVG